MHTNYKSKIYMGPVCPVMFIPLLQNVNLKRV